MRTSRLVHGLIVQSLIGLVLASGAAFGQQYLTTTVAGMGGANGYAGDGGPALSAQFANPLCVAVDSQGNYYIADSKNFVIRKVSAGSALISTVAGNGTIGFSGDGGPATSAQISTVSALAVDGGGNLYISDTGNARVRIVTTDGNINTLAGNGTRGNGGDGGPAANAQLYFPAGLAIDAKGNLYIADYGLGVIRKVSPQGIITRFAGVEFVGFGAFPGEGGPALNATLGLPYSLAADESGNVFVADIGTSSIRKITTDGTIHTFVPQVSTASLAADPAGNLYYADYRQNTVVKVYPNGSGATIAGSYTAGYVGDYAPAVVAQFNQPYGIAVDSSSNIYVADYANNVIRFLQVQPSNSVLVTNGASNYIGPIAPGEIVTLFGSGIGPSTPVQAQPDGNNQIETNLAGTIVTLNGIPAPIVSTSFSQVAVQTPFELAGATQATVIVAYQGQPVASAIAQLTPLAPQIFSSTSAGYSAPPLNSDGSVNVVGNAAAENSNVTVFVTGAGVLSPAGATGAVAVDTSATPAQSVTATVNGVAANVVSATISPGLINGIIAVQLTLPSSVTTTTAAPVIVQVGTTASLPVYIAVQ